ncbi:glycosyl hydrolase family 8 [Microvirga arsenatis]|uniref:cellulase n=1 Tax=Microvirga arsenatis TaxID=2692265 RepID=A0ABW9YWE5_9HYPH|nr:glycosyl hydrolase family 8 [Microvirga arsenatis]NBJ10487.1 endoglucanase [Microvirga arsenatis]NBJ24614.1 endoglucanase [Microvirga arsenatis]
MRARLPQSARFLPWLVSALLLWTGSMAASQTLSVQPLRVIGSLPATDWEAYRFRFVEDNGRVVDTANGQISHSEGQGYGLLLALAAADRRSFEQIWNFTFTELLIRDDGLAAWKWDPNGKPRVTDRNNATDGDILIAYALAKAGSAWQEPRYTKAAQNLARAIGKSTFARSGRSLVLLPGAQGFGSGERPDGPVVNLSYWVFEAFPVLAALAPEYEWDRVWRDGVLLLQQATSGRIRLPADWISLENGLQPKPADGFPPEFGYNSLRIPLYLLRAGMTDLEWLRALKQRWSAESEGVAVVNVVTGQVRERLNDRGYGILPAALACALEGTPVPAPLRAFEPGHYYPSTLHLLAKSLLGEKYPQCV